MNDPFANLGRTGGDGTQPPSYLVTPVSSTPTPTTSPAPTPAPISTPSSPTDEEVMQHILVDILLEGHHGQFVSAFEIAGITQPFHVTLLEADELVTLRTTAGKDLETPIPINVINKKLWSGMVKVHDRMLEHMGVLLLPNEAWMTITNDDVIDFNLAKRQEARKPGWDESFEDMMEDSKPHATPKSTVTFETNHTSLKPKSMTQLKEILTLTLN